MKHYEFERIASDGLELFFRGFEPKGEIKGVVCLIHGMGEHSGRYAKLASHLAGANFAMLTFDLRGHGRHRGPRGHTPSYEALMSDLSLLIQEAEQRFPGKAIFLYGHSMGGNLVLNYALRFKPKLKGVIASSPWLQLAFIPPLYKLMLARILNLFFPSFSMSTDLNPKSLSQDAKEVAAYEKDPLVHDRITPRMYLSIHDAAAWVLEHAGEFSLPLLIMHGSGDKVTSADASNLFAGRAKCDCTFKPWHDLYHELHNEIQQAEVFVYLLDWLEAHLR